MAKFTESSGDVFRDLGFDEADAQQLRLRSDLMIRLQGIVSELRLPQRDVAVRLGITQPRVSDLLRGKLHKFSLEMLTQMLTRLGAHVSVQVDDFFVGQPHSRLGTVWSGYTAHCSPITPGAPPRMQAADDRKAADTQFALAA